MPSTFPGTVLDSGVAAVKTNVKFLDIFEDDMGYCVALNRPLAHVTLNSYLKLLLLF